MAIARLAFDAVNRLQDTPTLTKLAVPPDKEVKRGTVRTALVPFAWRVPPLPGWFGMVECVENREDLETSSRRKSALSDRFL